MPLGRKHLRRSRDAPTGGMDPSKNYFYSAELVPGSQLPMERSERSPATGSGLSVQAFSLSALEALQLVDRDSGRDELAAIS